jgi:glycosyltransferase involved in cell wall biosynthesis
VTDGLEALLHRTVVGLADRGHHVRVVGASAPHELDPVDHFRLQRSLRVSVSNADGLMRRACRFTGSLAHSALVDARQLRAAARRIRRRQRLGRTFVQEISNALPVLGERADVVYFEAANVLAEYAAVADYLGPRIVMCTGSDVRILPDETRWLADALPAVFAGTARVVCRSEDLRHWAIVRGAPAARTTVLYPSVDTEYFAPPRRPPRPGDALRVVSVARSHWVKGLEFAVQAVALARAAGHDVVYTIVGPSGPARPAVEYAVRDLGLTDAVTFAGPRSQAGVRAALARADVYLLSSVGEGASRAVLEAMAMAVPIVTTDAGGMTEILEAGREGVGVPRRDPRALADAISMLATDPARRAEMGRRARVRAEQFDDRAHLERLEQILVNVAGGASAT